LRDELLKSTGSFLLPFDSDSLIEWLNQPDEEVVGGRFSAACYVNESIPSVVYLAYKYSDDPEKCIVANTNLGGDNAYRGTVLGALLGAANGFRAWPERWIEGLLNPPPPLQVEEVQAEGF
jgi:ADP-ribosyl-[dinitrogen reductase] hydrolase